ncbi:hypothetical protein ABT300_21710 [Streptomyces sp. NPDC001027]
MPRGADGASGFTRLRRGCDAAAGWTAAVVAGGPQGCPHPVSAD